MAQRIIDTNISRDLPDHISYLTQSRRLVLFQPNNKHLIKDTTELETEFHRVMTYGGWITEFTRLADGTKLNGWGHVNVSYDPTMPGHVAVEYVQCGHLIFDVTVKDIQQAPLVAQVYEVTTVDLYNMAQDYGFDLEVTAQLMEQLENVQNNSSMLTMNETNRIYRSFFKEKGKVYASWFSQALQKYLKVPEEFFNGAAQQIQEMPPIDPLNPTMVAEPVLKWVPIPATEYPYYFYLNRITECEPIIGTLGRATLDFYTQEAASTIWSSFVNGCTEAANVMWSPENPDLDAPVAPKQLTFIVEHGKLWNTPMRAFSAPYPPATLPNALEMLRTQNAEDTNNVSFATNNRKDTRKTATELEMAQQQDTVMSTISVTAWATCLGKIWNAAWTIIQAEALQGKIVFCADEQGQNNLQLIGADYKLIPAGTTDYVERMEKMASMQSDMPIVMPTAAGPAFLEEYLRMKYPQNAETFITPLKQQAQQGQQVVEVLSTLLQQAVTDESGQNLRPEWQAHAQELAKLGIKAGPAQPQMNETPNPTQDPAAGPA